MQKSFSCAQIVNCEMCRVGILQGILIHCKTTITREGHTDLAHYHNKFYKKIKQQSLYTQTHVISTHITTNRTSRLQSCCILPVVCGEQEVSVVLVDVFRGRAYFLRAKKAIYWQNAAALKTTGSICCDKPTYTMHL